MKKILIVDDSKLMRSAIAKSLSKFDLEIVGNASNGLEAIDMFEKYKPDIVSLDITMPKMNGDECIEKFKEINPDCNIVVLTALKKHEKLEAYLDTGVSSIIYKPFNERIIREEFGKYLQIKSNKSVLLSLFNTFKDLAEKNIKEFVHDDDLLNFDFHEYDSYIAMISFGGKYKGYLSLKIHGEILYYISKNLFKIDSKEDNDLQDMCCEFLNSVSGEITDLVNWNFEISIPIVLKSEEQFPSTLKTIEKQNGVIKVGNKEILIITALKPNN